VRRSVGPARCSTRATRGRRAAVTGVPTDFAYLSRTLRDQRFREQRRVHGNTVDRRYSWRIAKGEWMGWRPWSTRARRRCSGPEGRHTGFDAAPSVQHPPVRRSQAGIPVATGVEARLIEAEAALRADTATASVRSWLRRTTTSECQPSGILQPQSVDRTNPLTNQVPVLPSLTATDATTRGGAVNCCSMSVRAGCGSRRTGWRPRRLVRPSPTADTGGRRIRCSDRALLQAGLPRPTE